MARTRGGETDVEEENVSGNQVSCGFPQTFGLEMAPLIRLLLVVLASATIGCDSADRKSDSKVMLDYDKAIFLDAEFLAELGIAVAYSEMAEHLKGFGVEPDKIDEIADNDIPTYAIRHNEIVHEVYNPRLDRPEDHAWGRATVIFFEIVNSQLTVSDHKFYAISGGHDLAGIFLTEAEMLAAREDLSDRRDWPYLPKFGDRWFGMPH